MVHICVECASVFVVCGVYVWFVLVCFCAFCMFGARGLL